MLSHAAPMRSHAAPMLSHAAQGHLFFTLALVFWANKSTSPPSRGAAQASTHAPALRQAPMHQRSGKHACTSAQASTHAPVLRQAHMHQRSGKHTCTSAPPSPQKTTYLEPAQVHLPPPLPCAAHLPLTLSSSTPPHRPPPHTLTFDQQEPRHTNHHVNDRSRSLPLRNLSHLHTSTPPHTHHSSSAQAREWKSISWWPSNPKPAARASSSLSGRHASNDVPGVGSTSSDGPVPLTRVPCAGCGRVWAAPAATAPCRSRVPCPGTRPGGCGRVRATQRQRGCERMATRRMLARGVSVWRPAGCGYVWTAEERGRHMGKVVPIGSQEV
eukprot:365605-Chlamydomonas_euryale.AAC.3